MIAGLKPGPRVGQILNQLLEKVIDKPGYNKKDKPIEMLKDRGID
ncbi:MAG: hypothetical protein H8D67_25870 [Deltaproteobacteria bacterium]|nr:hypothetical protein [Deltaproteobacteria bacterium]